jgi:hypothetical protein
MRALRNGNGVDCIVEPTEFYYHNIVGYVFSEIGSYTANEEVIIRRSLRNYSFGKGTIVSEPESQGDLRIRKTYIKYILSICFSENSVSLVTTWSLWLTEFLI